MKRLIRDERMAYGFGRLESPIWIPSQTPRDKIHESVILRLQRLLQRLRARPPSASLTADRNPRLANGVEEKLLPGTPVNQMTVRRTEYLHNTSQLLLLVLAREDGVARPQFRKNAAETPHIDPQTIATAQYYLWGAVEAGLDVRVHLLLLAAGGAEVDDADIRFSSLT
jgi:hypothetical protein